MDKLKDSLAKNPEWRTLTVKELLELRGYQSFTYRSSGNHILVDGAVGSTKATFLIDTGAYSGLFDLNFAKAAGLEIGPMDQVVHGIGGTAPAARTKVPRFTMGDAVIENRTLLSCDLFKNSGAIGGKGDHEAIFGADFLRELDGVISYKEARIFSSPTTPTNPPPTNRPHPRRTQRPPRLRRGAVKPAPRPGASALALEARGRETPAPIPQAVLPHHA